MLFVGVPVVRYLAVSRRGCEARTINLACISDVLCTANLYWLLHMAVLHCLMRQSSSSGLQTAACLAKLACLLLAQKQLPQIAHIEVSLVYLAKQTILQTCSALAMRKTDLAFAGAVRKLCQLRGACRLPNQWSAQHPAHWAGEPLSMPMTSSGKLTMTLKSCRGMTCSSS